MNINQASKIHNPDLLSENIAHYNVKLKKENKIAEIQQKKAAEIEIVMTMLEKGYINVYKMDKNFNPHIHGKYGTLTEGSNEDI